MVAQQIGRRKRSHLPQKRTFAESCVPLPVACADIAAIDRCCTYTEWACSSATQLGRRWYGLACLLFTVLSSLTASRMGSFEHRLQYIPVKNNNYPQFILSPGCGMTLQPYAVRPRNIRMTSSLDLRPSPLCTVGTRSADATKDHPCKSASKQATNGCGGRTGD